MKNSLFAACLLTAALLSGGPQHAAGQSSARAKAKDTKAYIPWFTVQNKAIVVQTGTTFKPLDTDVTLPNGIRVDHRTQTIVLTNGTRVVMKEGDMLSLNGDFTRNPNAVADAPTVAGAAPLPAPAGAAPVSVAPAVAATVAPAPAAPAVAVVSAPVALAATFAYRPATPVNGTLRGVVELGASGFNMFIVRVDAQRNWKLEKSEFGNSLVMEKMATEEDIRMGLKSYIGKMLDFGVPGRDIHFVVSSGAALSESTTRIVKGLEALKYVVTKVSPEREGALGLRAALLPGFADKAFVVDMGSANSKIAWLDNGTPHVVDTYGSKYFQSSVDPNAVAADVKAKAAQVPAKLRGTCFILGGVPYELAKAARQGQEPYSVLRLANAYPELTGAKNQAGLSIYRAVAEATGCQQFIFAYDANFTIGYLLSLP